VAVLPSIHDSIDLYSVVEVLSFDLWAIRQRKCFAVEYWPFVAEVLQSDLKAMRSKKCFVVESWHCSLFADPAGSCLLLEVVSLASEMMHEKRYCFVEYWHCFPFDDAP